MTFHHLRHRRLINDNISRITQELLLFRLRLDNCHF